MTHCGTHQNPIDREIWKLLSVAHPERINASLTTFSGGGGVLNQILRTQLSWTCGLVSLSQTSAQGTKQDMRVAGNALTCAPLVCSWNGCILDRSLMQKVHIHNPTCASACDLFRNDSLPHTMASRVFAVHNSADCRPPVYRLEVVFGIV